MKNIHFGFKNFDKPIVLGLKMGLSFHSRLASKRRLSKLVLYMMGGLLTKEDLKEGHYELIVQACQEEIGNQHPIIKPLTEGVFANRFFEIEEENPSLLYDDVGLIWLSEQVEILNRQVPLRPLPPEKIIDLRINRNFLKRTPRYRTLDT